MILVLAGTSDGRQLAKRLSHKGYNILATAVSQYGGALLESSGASEVMVKGLTFQELKQTIIEKKIKLVIDATHPFAQEISRQAIEITQELAVPYLRFERKNLALPQNNLLYPVKSMEEAAQKAVELGKNIFLTTGSKTLETFLAKQQKGVPRIIARVLPDPKVLEKCFSLGLAPKDIVALQGPFSKELNKALFQQYAVDLVVSKESGATGGTDSKVEAALELDIPLIIVQRPLLNYPLVVETFEKVEEFLQKFTQAEPVYCNIFNLESLAKQLNCKIAHGENLETLQTLLRSGQQVDIFTNLQLPVKLCQNIRVFPFFHAKYLESPQTEGIIFITNEIVLPPKAKPFLILVPCNVVMGIDCQPSTKRAALIKAIWLALERQRIDVLSLSGLAIEADKQDWPVLQEVSQDLNIPLLPISAEKLPEEAKTAIPWQKKLGLTRTSEILALAVASNTQLLSSKQRIEGINVALAQIL